MKRLSVKGKVDGGLAKEKGKTGDEQEGAMSGLYVYHRYSHKSLIVLVLIVPVFTFRLVLIVNKCILLYLRLVDLSFSCRA